MNEHKLEILFKSGDLNNIKIGISICLGQGLTWDDIVKKLIFEKWIFNKDNDSYYIFTPINFESIPGCCNVNYSKYSEKINFQMDLGQFIVDRVRRTTWYMEIEGVHCPNTDRARIISNGVKFFKVIYGEYEDPDLIKHINRNESIYMQK